MNKVRKKHKAKSSTAQVSPLTTLRPRLDALLSDTTVIDTAAPDFLQALDSICAGVKPADVLPILLRAYHSALETMRQRLDDLMPHWLHAHDAVDVLHTLVQRQHLNPQSQARALAWLTSAGINPAALPALQPQTPFYGAYRYTDDSQGLLNIFWYSDGRQQKLQGLGFLIDYNPPWEGAIKDLLVCGPADRQRILQRYVHSWAERGMPLQPISEAEAKRDILHCLMVNRREGIRLPRDLQTNRRLFVERILTLPDMPDTPPFTVEDFDALSRTGKTAESIRHFEQHVGRRVRLDDGKELLVMGDIGDPFDHEP